MKIPIGKKALRAFYRVTTCTDRSFDALGGWQVPCLLWKPVHSLIFKAMGRPANRWLARSESSVVRREPLDSNLKRRRATVGDFGRIKSVHKNCLCEVNKCSVVKLKKCSGGIFLKIQIRMPGRKSLTEFSPLRHVIWFIKRLSDEPACRGRGQLFPAPPPPWF